MRFGLGTLRAGVAVLLFLHPAVGGAQAGAPIDAAAIRLDYTWGEGSALLAESFELSAGVPRALGALGFEDRIVVLDFPVAPGERADVELERYDVYHPSARIVVVDDEGEREIPRSPRVHLLGRGVLDPEIRLGLSLDPDGGALSGLVSAPAGIFEWISLSHGEPEPDRFSYELGAGFEKRIGLETRTACGVSDLPVFFDPGPEAAPAGRQSRSSHTHEAALAFDTDGEFVGDYASPAAANTAIGDFITSANVIYERDLALRLQQAYTILRTSAAADPYVSSSTFTQLGEVGDEWEANRAGIPRTWVALLSGKGATSPFGCSGAGIAWVDQYCDTIVSGGPFDGGSYSATQVLRCVSLSGSSNTNLIGHEVGHNAGSGHTHCYTPEVDQCYKAEAGCYAGAVSCPSHGAPIPNDKGTVMSYCNFGPPDGADCGSNAAYFHPTVSALIMGKISANTPACVSSAAACPAGINELTVGNTTDSGVITHDACISVTFGPDYTASGSSTVTADAPLIVFGDDVSLDGTFTAEN